MVHSPVEAIHNSIGKEYCVKYASQTSGTEGICSNDAIVIDNGETERWVEAVANTATASRPTACVVPSRTNTKYWHKWILQNQSAVVYFVEGRLTFPGHKRQSPTASAVVLFVDKPVITTVQSARLKSYAKAQTLSF